MGDRPPTQEDFADMNPYDWIPHIRRRGLPREEMATAQRLQSQLCLLLRYVKDFASALALFDFCLLQSNLRQSQDPPTGYLKDFPLWENWPLIAARDGAMAIYHFGKTFEQINASLRSCPTISRFMNEEQLTSARRHLRNLFPKFEAVRNAVAHSAESLKTREKIEEHSVRGSVQIGGFNLVSGLGRTLVQDFLVGREFANTYEGKLQSYEMSEDTLEGMYMICLELYEAFDKVETETKRMASHSKGGFMQPEAT